MFGGVPDMDMDWGQSSRAVAMRSTDLPLTPLFSELIKIENGWRFVTFIVGLSVVLRGKDK
jgi:hypothetical protein